MQPFHVFRDYKGKKIEQLDLNGKLGMGKGKLVVMVLPGQKILPEVKKLLSNDSIFLHNERNANKD